MTPLTLLAIIALALMWLVTLFFAVTTRARLLVVREMLAVLRNEYDRDLRTLDQYRTIVGKAADIIRRHPQTSVLDGRTQSLIRLAVSNPEPKEAASAAMIVCKRLKKAIDT